MSLGSSNMARSALGTAFFLLILGYITEGLTNAEVSQSNVIEATVGQDVTLPCTITDMANLKIVNIEWTKKTEEENTKVAVYNPNFGLYPHWPNVSMQTEINDADKLVGFYLNLYEVRKSYSGLYNCDITTFPLGSIRREVVLKIKDVDDIMCDGDRNIEAQKGENVTISCRAAFTNAQYKWTKNKKLVSERDSLELWRVTGADAGVYTLTVTTENRSLHKEFNIIVFTTTTRLTTALVTVSPQPTVTTDGVISSAGTSHTTSLTTPPSTADTSLTWTAGLDTDVTDDTLSNVTITAGEHTTYDAPMSVTLSSATHNDTSHSPTSTTLGHGSAEPTSTQEMARDEMRNESTSREPTENPDVRPEQFITLAKITESSQNPNTNWKVKNVVEDNVRSHLLVIIMVPLLLLIAVAGFLYRRHVIKQRMDLPPPFKPPPPPVKYTTVKQCEIPAKSFPVSRCDSVQMFI